MKLYYSNRGNLNQSNEAIALLEAAFYINYRENMPLIEKTAYGKPFFPGRPDLHFSLSHSKKHVMCALSDYPIGIDIESERYLSQRVIKYYSTAEELRHFHPLDLWILKESYIKLFGNTIIQMADIHFYKENNLIITPDKSVHSQLYINDNFRAAVSTTDSIFAKTIEHI